MLRVGLALILSLACVDETLVIPSLSCCMSGGSCVDGVRDPDPLIFPTPDRTQTINHYRIIVSRASDLMSRCDMPGEVLREECVCTPPHEVGTVSTAGMLGGLRVSDLPDDQLLCITLIGSTHEMEEVTEPTTCECDTEVPRVCAWTRSFAVGTAPLWNPSTLCFTPDRPPPPNICLGSET